MDAETVVAVIPENTPIGTPVFVTRDDGTVIRTRTRAQPMWFTRRARKRGSQNESRLVVVVEDLQGTIDCARIRLVTDRQMDLFERFVTGRQKAQAAIDALTGRKRK